jgi:hypothetical protein
MARKDADRLLNRYVKMVLRAGMYISFALLLVGVAIYLAYDGEVGSVLGIGMLSNLHNMEAQGWMSPRHLPHCHSHRCGGSGNGGLPALRAQDGGRLLLVLSAVALAMVMLVMSGTMILSSGGAKAKELHLGILLF